MTATTEWLFTPVRVSPECRTGCVCTMCTILITHCDIQSSHIPHSRQYIGTSILKKHITHALHFLTFNYKKLTDGAWQLVTRSWNCPSPSISKYSHTLQPVTIYQIIVHFNSFSVYHITKTATLLALWIYIRCTQIGYIILYPFKFENSPLEISPKRTWIYSSINISPLQWLGYCITLTSSRYV